MIFYPLPPFYAIDSLRTPFSSPRSMFLVVRRLSHLVLGPCRSLPFWSHRAPMSPRCAPVGPPGDRLRGVLLSGVRSGCEAQRRGCPAAVPFPAHPAQLLPGPAPSGSPLCSPLSRFL